MPPLRSGVDALASPLAEYTVEAALAQRCEHAADRIDSMEEEQLLRSIFESPEDDDPRLVYADWLESRGDAARAMFIRAQCAAAKLPPWERTRLRQPKLAPPPLPPLPKGLFWS